jgi:hypothetical protein
MNLQIHAAIISVAIILSGCGVVADEETGSVVYESVIEVHWITGVQTSHYMFGPHPGDGQEFKPGPDWAVPLKGATANSIGFMFNHPTVRVNKALWRLIWAPGKSQARLMVTYRDLVNHIDEEHEVVQFDSWRNDAVVEQKVDHPLSAPRPVDVDITEAFNAAIATGKHSHIFWQVKK